MALRLCMTGDRARGQRGRGARAAINFSRVFHRVPLGSVMLNRVLKPRLESWAFETRPRPSTPPRQRQSQPRPDQQPAGHPVAQTRPGAAREPRPQPPAEPREAPIQQGLHHQEGDADKRNLWAVRARLIDGTASHLLRLSLYVVYACCFDVLMGETWPQVLPNYSRRHPG